MCIRDRLKGASSTAIVLVAVIIHPFVALYQFKLGLGESPAVDAMLRIEPFFCLFICGIKNFPQKKTALELTAKTLSLKVYFILYITNPFFDLF